ncbi:MAG: VOC family protein [Pseudomonadales bacterium]|nr:VOC family protein [Pseudomonadales bacterium]
MKIDAIDHVTLYVRSIAKVKSFYMDLFELSCREFDENDSRYLVVENETLHFFIMEDKTVTPEFVGMQHISFSVESLDTAIEQLKLLGHSYCIGRYEGFEKRNFDWCEWRDPEGIKVECIQYI